MTPDTRFSEEFAEYVFPFLRSDDILAAKDEGTRRMYYEHAKCVTDNEAFRQEVDEMKRSLYATLATALITDVQRDGYRLALLTVADFEKRMRSLAERARNMTDDAAKDLRGRL